MARTALYPGSFDPVTNGHLDVLIGACRIAERVVMAIGTHPSRQPLFTVEERLAMLKEVCGPVAAREKSPSKPPHSTISSSLPPSERARQY